MARQTWSSRLTYIMTVAGATIGFGATWRFPYLVGENGGGAYVLMFILVMLSVGIPIILVENVIGRRAQTNSVDAFFTKNSTNSQAWKFFGYLGTLRFFWHLVLLHANWWLGYLICLPHLLGCLRHRRWFRSVSACY